jgi:hypothetical protein
LSGALRSFAAISAGRRNLGINLFRSRTIKSLLMGLLAISNGPSTWTVPPSQHSRMQRWRVGIERSLASRWMLWSHSGAGGAGIVWTLICSSSETGWPSRLSIVTL